MLVSVDQPWHQNRLTNTLSERFGPFVTWTPPDICKEPCGFWCSMTLRSASVTVVPQRVPATSLLWKIWCSHDVRLLTDVSVMTIASGPELYTKHTRDSISIHTVDHLSLCHPLYLYKPVISPLLMLLPQTGFAQYHVSTLVGVSALPSHSKKSPVCSFSHVFAWVQSHSPKPSR